MVATSPSATTSASPNAVPACSRVIHPVPASAPARALPSLLAFLAEVPDPRDPRGVRPPFSALLGMVRLAMLSGIQGYQQGRKKGSRNRQTPQTPVPDPDGIAIDGKTLRGNWKRGAEIAHMLAVVTHGLGLTLAQARIGRKHGELTALRSLLKQWFLEGLVVTVDAAFTHRGCPLGG